MKTDIYRQAWELLINRELPKKTSWGRNELKEVMLQLLIEAGQCNIEEKN